MVHTLFDYYFVTLFRLSAPLSIIVIADGTGDTVGANKSSSTVIKFREKNNCGMFNVAPPFQLRIVFEN